MARQRVTLAAMCLAQVMVLLDATIVNVALPSIQRELEVPPGNLEWIANAYTLTLASTILLGGTLGDRYGRRRVFIIGLVVFTLASVGCALAPDDPQLIALRGIQGLGGAAMAPMTLSLLVAAFPGAQAPRAVGIWAAVGSLGFGLGPVIGGALVDTFDWSSVFWVNVPLAVVCLGLTVAAVQESRDPEARRLDGVGGALATSTLFVFTIALVGLTNHPLTSVRTLALLALSAVLAAGFLRWESTCEHAMVPLDLFRHGRLSAVVIATVCAYVALGGLLYLLPLLFQNVKGYEPFDAGLSLLPISAAFMVTAPLSGRVVRRFGASDVIAAGCGLSAVAVAGVALTGVGTAYIVFVPLYILVGLGFGLIMPTVAVAAIAAVDRARSGLASGIVNASRQVGAALGVAALGTLSATIAAHSWERDTQSISAGLASQAAALDQAVAGGRRAVVQRALGGDWGATAAAAFVSGMRVALLCAAAALIAGAFAILVTHRATPGSAPSNSNSQGGAHER